MKRSITATAKPFLNILFPIFLTIVTYIMFYKSNKCLSIGNAFGNRSKNRRNNGYTVTTLIDRQAKANKIEAEINNLLALEDGNDYIVLIYSGHGAKYSNYGSCIISHDLYYITHGWFESKFVNADSPHIYFTFDACEIGDFQGLIGTNRVGAFGSNNEYSWETSEFENGVFTYYQMEGWNSKDNFEDDTSYAITQMEDWATYNGVEVDPFLKDSYDGSMIP